MLNLKIFGAGSIGNHVAHAARRLGWSVTVCDRDPAALERMKAQIYPGRYKSWDDAIRLFLVQDCPRGGFDVIHVGTPPDAHISVALDALREEPRALVIEKPLCTPGLEGMRALLDAAQRSRSKVFVGYDHVLGAAAAKLTAMLGAGTIGKVKTLDVEFREHWGGIFAAHPWLAGPSDSYLGFSSRGGGAGGEHSHALHFWQFLAHQLDAGPIEEVSAELKFVEDGRVRYDELFLLSARTRSGLLGRVAQDVVTCPPRKRARLQGERGALEWICGYDPSGDAVLLQRPGMSDEITPIPKTRPDDFLNELRHVEAQLRGAAGTSPISLERGVETMTVLAAAHRSHETGARVKVEWAANLSNH